MNLLIAWRQERDYRNFFSAGFVSGIGHRFSQIAIFALVFELTGAAVTTELS
ncbi:hypothetical protein [Halalkalibacter akibai]|uniref:Uncharacterized protein n=1 Tax=Halalkalibacter akibai (strain ATCC 43226 / DSM 21942 / CIP 109018 / JCM 9157 / 1139) TaxID=1236973 RepID=W4QNM7_HALA3|nr:hypothetical protein [Halalkalibacter akibai]GAE33720.1 hypothetical protein JCM9157_742 [Halalkalibacter akibai JCM 9157]